jgi:hypothetical protein
MTLSDTVSNIGCVSRDAVTSTGKDLVFLDKSGLRSLSRTIQEKSAPLGDISRNVDEDIKLIISNETGNIQLHYAPIEAFVISLFPSQDQSYVFDTKRQIQDGSYRATTWTSMGALCFTNLIDDTLYIGTSSGISTYSGYNDNTATYVLSYSSHPLTFGNSSTLKFLKRINVTTFNGANALVTLSFAYDYATAYKKRSYTLPATNVAQYGIAEYNLTAEYSNSITLINREKVNAAGQGAAVSVGLETTVNGNSIAIQELNIQALVGRII